MNNTYKRWPELNDFIKDIQEVIYKASRPANEVILDEVEFCNMLKISKRLASDLRRDRLIEYSKCGGKIYYRLSSVLEYINRNLTPSIYSQLKIK
jgi:hypothetical protein